MRPACGLNSLPIQHALRIWQMEKKNQRKTGGKRRLPHILEILALFSQLFIWENWENRENTKPCLAFDHFDHFDLSNARFFGMLESNESNHGCPRVRHSLENLDALKTTERNRQRCAVKLGRHRRTVSVKSQKVHPKSEVNCIMLKLPLVIICNIM